jgi:hypothetical protein
VSIPQFCIEECALITTVLTLTVSVGIQDRPSAAPQFGPWQSDFELFKSPTFAEAAAALSSIVFAFCGIPAYFNVVSEMKDHKDYFKALSLCQFVMTSIYIAIGVVVYYYCGSYVASPALGSAGILMKKVCYGLALLGLLASVILVIHVSSTSLLFAHNLLTSYSSSPSTSSSALCAEQSTSAILLLSTGSPGSVSLPLSL